MGEIADAMIEAEMHGYAPENFGDYLIDQMGEDEPMSEEDEADLLRSTIRLVAHAAIDAAKDGEAFQGTILRCCPNLTGRQAKELEVILEVMNAFEAFE